MGLPWLLCPTLIREGVMFYGWNPSVPIIWSSVGIFRQLVGLMAAFD